MKRVLIISGSPRINGNTNTLCEEIERGCIDSGNHVDFVILAKCRINYCLACDYCMRNDHVCVQNDDMKDIIELFKRADVLVLATPVYFYGISAQMKAFIDRMYPIWQTLGKKDVYYVVSAGLGLDIINRSLSDLDGFVEHLEEYEIKGRLYATNVMERGMVKGTSLISEAYNLGKNM